MKPAPLISGKGTAMCIIVTLVIAFVLLMVVSSSYDDESK
jgi:hypothetical protein